jgi:hypothetical protein
VRRDKVKRGSLRAREIISSVKSLIDRLKLLRWLLRAGPAGVAVPLLLGAALTMIYGGDFGLATGTTLVACAWGIAAWLNLRSAVAMETTSAKEAG